MADRADAATSMRTIADGALAVACTVYDGAATDQNVPGHGVSVGMCRCLTRLVHACYEDDILRGGPSGARARNCCVGDLTASAITRGDSLSLNQLCQRNCCGLRAEPCEITTLTRAGPRKF